MYEIYHFYIDTLYINSIFSLSLLRRGIFRPSPSSPTASHPRKFSTHLRTVTFALSLSRRGKSCEHPSRSRHLESRILSIASSGGCQVPVTRVSVVKNDEGQRIKIKEEDKEEERSEKTTSRPWTAKRGLAPRNDGTQPLGRSLRGRPPPVRRMAAAVHRPRDGRASTL